MLKSITVASQKLSFGARRIISNSGWLFADRALSIISGLFVGVWVARYLCSARFGLYNYIIAFVALFAPIAELGLSSIVVRNIVREPLRKDQIIGTAFALQIVGGFVAFAFMMGVALTLYSVSDLAFWMILTIGAQLIFTPFGVIDYWFQSQVQSNMLSGPTTLC